MTRNPVAGRRTAHDVRADFERDGFVFPFQVMSAEEAGQLEAAYFAFRASFPPELLLDKRSVQGHAHLQTHLLRDWIDDLTARPSILDLVEPLVGANLAVWHTQFLVKMPHQRGYSNAPLPWHQDEVNMAFEPVAGAGVTAWLALTAARPENGAMQFVPGSHTVGLLSFESNDGDEQAQLTRGSVLGIDTNGAVDVCLEPGQLSIHHPRLVHASGSNTTDRPRVAFLVRYVRTDVTTCGPHPVEGTVVRGRALSETFRVLEPQRYADRTALQRDNLRRMLENAEAKGFY
jgi:hypothetical protein